MVHYDEVPNYWDSTPHATRKLTERTNNCKMCHLIKMGFLNKSKLIKDGSKANEGLIRLPNPLKSIP